MLIPAWASLSKIFASSVSLPALTIVPLSNQTERISGWANCLLRGNCSDILALASNQICLARAYFLSSINRGIFLGGFSGLI